MFTLSKYNFFTTGESLVNTISNSDSSVQPNPQHVDVGVQTKFNQHGVQLNNGFYKYVV
jgi:hypothetical protein